MFARHGIQNALRTRRRSVAFLLLLTLLVTLLGTSLGLSFALQETLRQCRGNYSTIGLVEYLGPGYPSTARVVEDAGEVLAEFESRLDRSDPALVDWEPTRMALGYTPALESLTDYSVLENRFALVIRLTEQATRRIKGQDPDFYLLLDPDGQLVWQWGTGTPDREVKLPYYYANVVETLFSGERLAANQPVLLDVQEGSSADLSQDYNMPSDTIWKAGHYYLVQGVYTENELLGPSYKQLSPAPYQVNGVSLSQVSAIDITRPDGTCAELDGSTDIEAVGRTFQVTSHSLTAQATDRPADLLPFQQSELTLVQGDYYASGSKSCLISQTLADDLGLDVGGSLPLSLAVRENTLVPYSYWNSQGFDAQDTYTVSGIFSANEEYDSMVYIPVREDVDMTVNHCSYTLGQLQIRNGQAQAYVERLRAAARLHPDHRIRPGLHRRVPVPGGYAADGADHRRCVPGGRPGLSGAVRLSAGVSPAGRGPYHDPRGRCPAERAYLFPVLRRNGGPACGGAGMDPQPVRGAGRSEAAGADAGKRRVGGAVFQQHRPGHAAHGHGVSGSPGLGDPGSDRPGHPGPGAGLLPGVQRGQPGAAA